MKKRNKNIKTILFFFLFCGLIFSSLTEAAIEWEELKGDHFVVYYVKDKAHARNILRKAEQYYSSVASDLGFVRYSEFWSWDNRVKVFIFSEQSLYQEATGQPVWSIGAANYSEKTVSTYVESENFIDTTLPHEIAHLIFRDFVGFTGAIPLWLDEGVAQWQEPYKRILVKCLMKDYQKNRELIPLKKLMMMDVRSVSDDVLVQKFYVESASLIGFLIEKFGGTQFTQFCRQLRDGKDLDEALRFTYPTKIRNLNQLEETWLEYIAQLGVKCV